MAPRQELLEDAVLAYLRAVDGGSAPDPEEFLARHAALADELRAFLDTQQKLGRLLAPLRRLSLTPVAPAAVEPPAGDPRHTTSYHPADQEGAVLPSIPGYEVLGELGSGGMGVVYKARQVHMNRVVALKVVRASRLATETARARFRSEAQAVAKLDHPNIVRVFDSGEVDGLPYMALELVAGGSLQDALASGPWAPRRAAQVVAQLAGAVEYAHRQGVMHRDLKPANILLSADGVPRVSDFGLARHDEGAGQTHAGDRVGTAPYMAPEQADGRLEALGPATDVYGLGGILYALLTGRPPHGGATTSEVLAQASAGRVVPPRARNARVPAGLERICLKALSADPKGRYPSAAALGDDLRRYLRRPRRLVIALGVLVVAFLGGLGAWRLAVLLRHTPPPPAPPVALSGDLNVLIWSPEKRGLKVREWGALPVRNQEQVQAEVRLNQPAHVYLLWLDSEGVVTPLYPWNAGTKTVHKKLLPLPPEGPPQTIVLSPGEIDRGWIVGGKRGLDTILLLARQTPLSAPEDEALAELVGRLPVTPYHNPQEWAVRGFDGDQPVDALNLGGSRAPEEEAALIDEPLLQLISRLREHFHFEVIRAVRFAHDEG